MDEMQSNVKQQVLQKLMEAMEQLQADGLRPKPATPEAPPTPETPEIADSPEATELDAKADEMPVAGEDSEDPEMLEKLRSLYSKIS